jgi:hypothetical protein
MAMKWELEAEAIINDKGMEGMLIEIFGCISLENNVVNFPAYKERKRMTAPVIIEDSLGPAVLIASR